VTVSGRALPAKIAILVGGVPANVLPGNTANSASFLAPPMLAGRYDVAVYQQFGSVPTTLVSALTYQADAPPAGGGGASGAGGSGGSSSSPASSNGGTPTQPPATTNPTSPNQPAPSQPAPSQPAPSQPSSSPNPPGTQPTASPTPAPSASASAPQDSAAPNNPPASGPASGASGSSVVTTPDGLRLVHSSAVSALSDLSWDSSSCDAGDCDGVPL